MGEYSRKLDIYEYDMWQKKVKAYLLENDMSLKDLARATGYSIKTVYDALSYYERCSKFFVAQIDEFLEEHEKSN